MKVKFSSEMARISVVLLLIASGACVSPKKSSSPVVSGPQGVLLYDVGAVNSPESAAKPYVVLVSIDGYRYDYNKLFAPPNLVRLASEGVAADSLQPIYPSKTFPNHYSMVTGLYADRHGIVSNEFIDPARSGTYALSDRQAVEDGSWYFGEPLWVTAGKQEMLSASFFWAGSEAPVAGAYPNYFYRYDSEIPYERRVDQVLAWLKLPKERRPHLITVYFEAVDMAAHRTGVNTPSTREAVLKVDRMIGRLREGLAETGLPVNLIVVSDHGMQDLDAKKVIVLDETAEAARILSKFKMVGRGPQALLYLNKGEPESTIDEAQRILSSAVKNCRILKRSQAEALNYSRIPRAGDLIVEPDAPYAVGTRAQMPGMKGANHGWDPRKNKLMHGIFYAAGPAFKPRARLKTFENIHLYPLVLEILGLQQRVPVDGTITPTQPARTGPP